MSGQPTVIGAPAFGYPGQDPSPGETVARHEDVQLAARTLACEAASVYCATYESDHSAALHAAIEARVLGSTLPVADAIDEIHADLTRLREHQVAEAEIPERLRRMAS